MKLFDFWDRLRTSFWFLPSLMAGAAVALSFAMLEFDARLGPAVVSNVGWIYRFGPEGARTLLSSIASSMITVAGLTFSITMLTLQLATSQFGPRLLRNIMRDRGNQVVLGTFLATFLYCLLVLRAVRGTDGEAFVPHLSAALGVLFAVVSIAVLIYFIHHVASSIRIESLLETLAGDARAAIDRLYPETIGEPPQARRAAAGNVAERCIGPNRLAAPDFDVDAKPVRCGSSGYVQAIDAQALLRIAQEHGLVVRVDAAPGGFVSQRDRLLTVIPAGALSDRLAERLAAAFLVGRDRTPLQDLAYSLRRLVEVAQRGLSAGVNDPTTALYCIDRLVEAFEHLATRRQPSPLRADESGKLRVVATRPDSGDLACQSFAAVARYALADADVSVRLVHALTRLAACHDGTARERLLALGEEIVARAAEAARLSFDRQAVDTARQRLVSARVSPS
ncbi:MAG TPA: DUF2254 domain-containing protein [Zeimonas sp.]